MEHKDARNNTLRISRQQLDLPFKEGCRETWTVALPGPRAARTRLTISLSGTGASLLMTCRGHEDMDQEEPGHPSRELVWSADIHPSPPAYACTRRVALKHVPNPGKPGERPDLTDLFREGITNQVRFLPEGVRFQPAAMLRASAPSMARIAEHLAPLFMEDAVKAARAFPPTGGVRWWMYCAAANDASGRVAQQMTICPGPLLMAMALGQESGSEERGQVLARIVAGGKLTAVVREAAEQWRQAVCTGGPWPAMMAQGPVDEATRQAQRIRIRRAGPRVPPTLLRMPPPPYLVPEDIPHDPIKNHKWFEVTTNANLHRALELLTSAQGEGLCKFISHNYESCRWNPLPDLLFPDTFQVDHLVDFLRDTGGRITRKASPDGLSRRLEQWQTALRLGSVGLPRDTPTIKVEIPDWADDGDKIRPLRTAGALYHESSRMNHCVAWRVRDAAAGRALLFHGEVRGGRITVEIRPGDEAGRYVLVQAAGHSNRPLNRAQWRVVRRWLDHLNAGGLSTGHADRLRLQDTPNL